MKYKYDQEEWMTLQKKVWQHTGNIKTENLINYMITGCTKSRIYWRIRILKHLIL